jgi:hypothetical protein
MLMPIATEHRYNNPYRESYFKQDAAFSRLLLSIRIWIPTPYVSTLEIAALV